MTFTNDEPHPVGDDDAADLSRSVTAATTCGHCRRRTLRRRTSSNSYRILIEFAHKHPDFQLAELRSVLEANGVRLVQEMTDAPSDDDDPSHPVIGASAYPSTSASTSATSSSLRQSCRLVPLPTGPAESTAVFYPLPRPYAVLDLWEEEEAAATGKGAEDEKKKVNSSSFITPLESIGVRLVEECTLVRSAVELWGMGDSIESCAESTRTFVAASILGNPNHSNDDSTSRKHNSNCHHHQQPLRSRHYGNARTCFESDQSWKLTVHSMGYSFSSNEQETVRSQFRFLRFPGPVQMNDPDNEFAFLQEMRLDVPGASLSSSHTSSVDASTNPSNNKTTDPSDVGVPSSSTRSSSSSNVSALCPSPRKGGGVLACYFGRVLGGARSTKGRAGLVHYTLKKRSYLGPTSMDAELAFVMASLGKVRKGSVVYDPFVGTGSILVACALRGAGHVVGSDIDIRVLRGKGPGRTIGANFAQFGLTRPELLRTDNAVYPRHFRSHRPLYDAIVTDPPYGIRAGARRCGSRLNQPRPVPEDQRSTHIPQTRPYPVSDVMADLLDVAARTLVPGGRLVYIVPSFSDFDPEEDLPRHDCLRLVHSCYQPLQGELGRRVIAMEKVLEYDKDRRDEYLSRIWKNGPESAEKVAAIRDKLLEAAKKKPRYDEKLAMRREKRKKNRAAKKEAKKHSLVRIDTSNK